jgi:predicted GNAT family acetyltransferase
VHDEIRRNEAASRYELVVDGLVVSFADFRDDGTRVVLPHTVTFPEFQGNGYAARVVRRALDDARASGKTVIPRCWFVAQFIDDNPEYHDLLAA